MERIVKSLDRVRDLGEVFTPRAVVEEMLALLPPEMWEPHPAPTFLEPACGDGNFLVAVLERKLDISRERWQAGRLPAGVDAGAFEFHALEALASLYGMDLSDVNVLGGVPEHPVGARERLLELFRGSVAAVTGRSDARVERSAAWIVEQNVQVADMLPGGPDRDGIPLIEYRWGPADRSVTVSRTTLGEIGDAPMTLFGGPVPVWSGPARELHLAEGVRQARAGVA